MIAAFANHVLRDPADGIVNGAGAIVRRLSGRTALRDQMPWMPWGAIRYLEGFLSPYMRVFEYGSGGSTLFLARRVASVFSVEHDPEWAVQVKDELRKLEAKQAELQVVQPVRSNEANYISDVEKYAGYSFRKYVDVIDRFSDGYFDLVIVDGRARNSCVRAAVSKIKPGGVLLLDNSERAKYAPALTMMDSYRSINFYGLNPYQLYPGRTTCWEIR